MLLNIRVRPITRLFFCRLQNSLIFVSGFYCSGVLGIAEKAICDLVPEFDFLKAKVANSVVLEGESCPGTGDAFSVCFALGLESAS